MLGTEKPTRKTRPCPQAALICCDKHYRQEMHRGVRHTARGFNYLGGERSVLEEVAPMLRLEGGKGANKEKKPRSSHLLTSLNL